MTHDDRRESGAHSPSEEDLKHLRDEAHVEIYAARSLLMDVNHQLQAIWEEGPQSDAAQARYGAIRESLEAGYLQELIEAARSPEEVEAEAASLTEQQTETLDKVVQSVRAERGRALVEIMVLQLAVKAIEAGQDVRLHKGRTGGGGFSWREGVSMRHLDDSYVAPVLREYDLMRMNQYGAFMTRSFAENYPYSLFYKAEIRGEKGSWLKVLDELEEGSLEAKPALMYVLGRLWQSSREFQELAEAALLGISEFLEDRTLTLREACDLLIDHIEDSESHARLLEVAIHALMQALDDCGIDLGGELKPLMPMRTANLKHGNVGDIEILLGDLLVEAWDAKYDTPYLADALEALRSKLWGRATDDLQVGFVVVPDVREYSEVERKIEALEEEFGVQVRIAPLCEWAEEKGQLAAAADVREEELAAAWLTAYTESLSQKRRDIAPIDEPTLGWLQTLREVTERAS